jgi:Na+/H+ antiporter NhaA
MALFIASAAFGSPELLAAAKIAILTASLLAALLGLALVTVTTPTQEDVSELDVSAAPVG